MRKLLVLAVFLSSFALAQNWEYAMIVIAEETMGMGYSWISDDITAGPMSSYETLLAELGVDSPGPAPLHTLLNYAGANGWELVTTNTTGGSIIFIFKREKE